VFCAALEQAEQLLTAAETVGHASRPILLFYGLSQAGRAVAAASTAVDGNHFRLNGHGITTPNLNQHPGLQNLMVINEGAGSFIQLADVLRSGTLPDGALFAQIWTSIPSLLSQPLGNVGERRPPLIFDVHTVQGINGTRQEIQGWVRLLPADLAAEPDQGHALDAFLAGYPALADSSQSGLLPDAFSPDDRMPGSMKAMRRWPWRDAIDPSGVRSFLKNFEDGRTIPYLGDDDRWVFPALGGSAIPLHQLLAWWALLFLLSMLARYEPEDWIRHLGVDTSSSAVPLEAVLGIELDVCPQLILHAIRAVSSEPSTA